MRQTIGVTFFLFCFVYTMYAQNKSNYPSNPEIQEIIQSSINKEDLAGIVTVVANGDGILLLNCAGYRNLDEKIKMDKNTLFWIASQSKPIAATAVMMLVDEGLLDLDEPISTYLPEMKRLMIVASRTEDFQAEKRNYRPITLRMLLSHTSGMKWVGGVQERMGLIDIVPLNIGIYISAMTPLEVEPSTEFRYSNQGVNTAAAIVERISGMPYEEFLQKRLFNPLGMKNTSFWPGIVQQKKLAIPYKKVGGVLKKTKINQLQYPLEDRIKRHVEAAGGLFSSPVDLVRFYQMIANKGVYNGERFLSESSVMEMGKKQTGDHVETSYGLGWAVSDQEMSHGGSYGTDTRVNKESGLITMYFVQESGLDKQNKESLDAFVEKAKQLYNDSE